MRELKFRAWHEEAGEYCDGTTSNMFKWLEDGQPVIIEQFTDLHDCNGVEIYEGDIVDGVGSHVGHSDVFYGYGQWQPFSYLGTYNGSEFKVIGNIHQNPELLA
jgi:hypothetical protein